MEKTKLLVLGIDAATWKIINPNLSELPNIKSLIEDERIIAKRMKKRVEDWIKRKKIPGNKKESNSAEKKKIKQALEKIGYLN